MLKTVSAFGNEHGGAFCWHAEYRKRARSVKGSEIRPLFLFAHGQHGIQSSKFKYVPYQILFL